jgi:stage III sporulation protein AF
MEWLSDWIRQIILIIFIATFIDLLLPSTSLERYVKLVMGLIIIVSILQPVLQIVLQEDKWSSFHTMLAPTLAADREQIREKMEANRNQLTEVQREETQQRFQQTVSEWINKQVQQNYGVKVVSAKVTVKLTKETPVIQHIDVRGDKPPATTSIQPVQPIDLEQEVQAVTTIDHETKLQHDIQSFIASSWNLEEKQVSVHIHRS